MARDYKNSSSRNKNSDSNTKRKPAVTKQKGRSGGGGFGVFFAGLAVGLIAGAAGVEYYHREQVAPIAAIPTPTIPQAAPAQKDTAPRFEFYKLLPEMEVVVPEAEERALTEQPVSRPPVQQQQQPQQAPIQQAVVSPTSRYLLQVGAFKRFQDADRLKAQLALLGFEAKIHKAEHSGETWHRVRLGPFNDGQELKSIRDRLSGQGMEPVLLKLTG